MLAEQFRLIALAVVAPGTMDRILMVVEAAARAGAFEAKASLPDLPESTFDVATVALVAMGFHVTRPGTSDTITISWR